MTPCSRCTGYRPILDAFKAFAKVEPAAYTEEAIAASKAANGHHGSNGANGGTNGGTNGRTNGSNGKANGKAGKNGNGKVCPSTGRPCDCGDVDMEGTITSSSKHKEASCGPLTHSRPAGVQLCDAAGLETEQPRPLQRSKPAHVLLALIVGKPAGRQGFAEGVAFGGLAAATDARSCLATSVRPFLCHRNPVCGHFVFVFAVEPIFPAELRKRVPLELELPGAASAWYRPLSLQRLLELKKQHPAAKLVVGNTGGCGGVPAVLLLPLSSRCHLQPLLSVVACYCCCGDNLLCCSLPISPAQFRSPLDTLCNFLPLAATASATAEVGIEMKFKSLKYPVLIGATHIPELNAFEVHADRLQNYRTCVAFH